MTPAPAQSGEPPGANSPVPVSAVVLARNSSGIIERCVRSLSFADEVLVVDGGSDDDTVAIAQSLGARVLVNAWPGFAAQRRVALAHTTHDWVFFCDSDEEVPPALASELKTAASRARADTSIGGFRVRRRNQFLGAWMDAGPWARDYPLRLLRARAARVTDASVHEGFVVDGAVATLASPLHHYTHVTISESVRRLNLYTTLEARDRVPRRRIRALDPLVSPAGVFLKYYFVRGCWRAGVRGYLLASITAMYKSVLYIKTRSLQRAAEATERGGHG